MSLGRKCVTRYGVHQSNSCTAACVFTVVLEMSLAYTISQQYIAPPSDGNRVDDRLIHAAQPILHAAIAYIRVHTLTATSSFWPPYGISRAGHYIFCPCGFFHLLLLLSFFLFSSPILSRRSLDVYHTSTHGVRIYDAGLKCAARCSLKYRTQKVAKKSLSGHRRTTLPGYIL